MTHRGVATSARFLTGHSRAGGEDSLGEQVLAAGADQHTTLIVYMGLQVRRRGGQQGVAGEGVRWDGRNYQGGAGACCRGRPTHNADCIYGASDERGWQELVVGGGK